jgi:hypothetical protein
VAKEARKQLRVGPGDDVALTPLPAVGDRAHPREPDG